jgi:CBS domain-containing protein
MRCDEIMKRDIECARADAPVQQAARQMRDANIGFLPVCDENQRVLGAITDRDITIRVVAEGQSGGVPVESVMTREVVYCRPEDDVRTAEQRMATMRKSRIMCIDEDGTLCGVISLSDIAQIEDSEYTAETMREVTRREAHQVPVQSH